MGTVVYRRALATSTARSDPGILDDAAVVRMIGHHQFAAGRIFSSGRPGNFRHGARPIGADIEKFHPVPGERADDGARVTHTSSFWRGRRASKPAVSDCEKASPRR